MIEQDTSASNIFEIKVEEVDLETRRDGSAKASLYSTNGLNSSLVDPNDKRFEVNCEICLKKIRLNHEIIALGCNPKHFFHKQCTCDWLLKSELCPICKKEVVDLSVGRRKTKLKK